MDDQTIFNKEPTQEPTSTEDVKQQSDPNAPFANMLESIKTEDGRQKYADVSAALASVPHAQKHISDLEAEAEELRLELAKRQAAEEALQSFKENHQVAATPAEEVDYSKIADYVQQTLTEKETQATQSQNLNDVVQHMKTAYSEKAEEVFYAKAQEVGLSVDQINQLAAQSPAAALKLIGETKTNPMGNMQSSVNTETLQPAPEELSAKIPSYANTSDLTNAWRNAGKKVQLREQNNA